MRSHAAAAAIKHNPYPADRIEAARHKALVILEAMLQPVEVRFVEQALVLLIEELAHCDADWPQLMPRLVQCVRAGVPGARVAVITFTTLSQDCVSASFNSRLQPAARTVLMRQLRAHVAELFPRLQAILAAPPSIDLALACLECASQLLAWVHLVDVPQLQGVVDAYLALAVSRDSPRVRTAAIHALADLAGRKTADLDKLSPGGVRQLYAAVRAACEHVLQRQPKADERCACAVALNQLLEHHLPALHDALQGAGLCADALLYLTQHEDACLHVLPAWRLLIKARDLLPGPVATELVVRLASAANMSTDEEGEASPVLKDLAARMPAEACAGLVRAFSSLGTTARVAKVVEAVTQGLPPGAMARFANGDASGADGLVASADALIVGVLRLPRGADEAKVVQLLHALARFLCAPPRGPALYLGEALSRLVQAASAFTHPRDPHATVVTRKRAGNCVLTLCRRLYESKENHGFMAGTLLPALIECVKGTSLRPTERVLLLEAIVVAGKALPDHASRLGLMGSVLGDSVALLQRNAEGVFANLLRIDPAPARQELAQWDKRGFVQDMNSLPAESRDVFLAMMNVSTLSSEGLMNEPMWRAILPVAQSALAAVRLNRARGPEWSQTIHPVDARVLLSERVYADVVEELNQYGAVLGDGRCAIIALLSALRSAACELFSSARQSEVWLACAPAVFDVGFLASEEDRDLIALFAHITVPPALLPSVCAHVMARLEKPVARRIVLPASLAVEAALEVDAQARHALAAAFARSLVPLAAEHTDARRALVALLGHPAATKAAVEGLCALPAALLEPAEALPFAIFALRQGVASESTHRSLVVLVADLICRMAFGAVAAEVAVHKPKALLPDAVSALSGLLGPGTPPLLDDLAAALSDKALRDRVNDFFTGTTRRAGNSMSIEVRRPSTQDDDDWI